MLRNTRRQGQSQGQKQDEDFVDYDELGDVVAAVFQALRQHAPSTLRALQACPMDVMRSQLFRGVDRDERLAETADSWHLALLEKGFSEIPL